MDNKILILVLWLMNLWNYADVSFNGFNYLGAILRKQIIEMIK